MPGPHYKNNRKLEKSKGQKLCFITTLMPFEERHMYNNGNDKVIDCPEMIYTIPAINAMHRQVKKGEKAITSFKIWIPKEDKDEEHDNNEVIKKKEFIMKTAFFFRYDQTEERK